MGFSIKDDKGEWSGFDVDFCRALAAAIFNDPSKVQYVPLTATERFDALESPFMKAGCGKTARPVCAFPPRRSKTGLRAQSGRIRRFVGAIFDNKPGFILLADRFSPKD